MLQYGSKPQRARLPWFTDVKAIDDALRLPDLVCGQTAERQIIRLSQREYYALVAASPSQYPTHLIDGISPQFVSTDDGYWHVHVDLAANKKRQGDAAGIAMGRISAEYEERVQDPLMGSYLRLVRAYEVPLVAQIIAPVNDQVYITGVVRLILMLKYARGFNITSFSFDGWQSSEASQQLMEAGLVTAGMTIDKDTGIITGLPKPFSVDRSPQPYRELLESTADRRCLLPRYELLRKELREVEFVEPGHAPDHPIGGSKDVADPVAGVVGYLAAFGHAELQMPGQLVYDREDFQELTPGGLPQVESWAVEELGEEWLLPEDDQVVNFGVE